MSIGVGMLEMISGNVCQLWLSMFWGRCQWMCQGSVSQDDRWSFAS